MNETQLNPRVRQNAPAHAVDGSRVAVGRSGDRLVITITRTHPRVFTLSEAEGRGLAEQLLAEVGGSLR